MTTTVERPARPAADPPAEAPAGRRSGRLGPLADAVLAVGVGTAVLGGAVWLSSLTSEDFAGAVTGRMAFGGRGDKTLEIAGAVLAVLLAAAAHEASRAVRTRRGGRPVSAVPVSAVPTNAVSTSAVRTTVPEPTRVPTPVLAAVALAVAALGAVFLAFGLVTLLGGVGLVLPRGLALVVAALVVVVVVLRGTRAHFSDVRARLAAATVLGQAFFAPAVLAVLPPPVLTADGSSVLVRSWAAAPGWSFVAVVAAVVTVAARRRWVRIHTRDRLGQPRPGDLMVGPAVVVAAVAPAALVGMPAVLNDSYHDGEYLTPAYLLAEFGQVPFVDQVPARGLLVNYVPAWLTQTVTNDWAGLAAVGRAVVAVLVLAALFLLLRGVLGPGWAAALTIVAAPLAASSIAVNDLVMVALVVALHRALGRWPLPAAVGVFASSAVVALLLAPAQGLGYVLAGGALLGVRLVQRPPDVRAWPWSLGVAAGVAVLTVASGLHRLVLAALAYVRDQALVNDQVWGVPWIDSIDVTDPGTVAQSILGEYPRLGALVGLVVVLVVCLRAVRGFREVPALPLWLGLGLYAALQLPRALGRIDPTTLSRIGALGLVVLAVVVPVVLLTRARGRATTVGVVVTLAAAVAAPLAFGGTAPSAHLARVVERAAGLPTDPGLTSVATEPGAAALSRAVVAEELLELQATLAAQYEALLPDGAHRELLDLTNNQADFRYLEVDNPLTTAAVYNITAAATERANVHRVTERNPPLALLWHPMAVQHDGGGVALRTPALFGWVLDTYTPVACPGPTSDTQVIWGVQDLAKAPLGCTLPATEAEETALWATALGPPRELAALPRAWGAPRSQVLLTLSPEEVVTPTLVSADAAATVLDVPVRSGDLRSSVLSLTLACAERVAGTISWPQTRTTPAGYLRTELGDGHVLVPIGSYPSFFRASGLASVRVDLPGASGCEIGGAVWLSRDGVPAAAGPAS